MRSISKQNNDERFMSAEHTNHQKQDRHGDTSRLKTESVIFLQRVSDQLSYTTYAGHQHPGPPGLHQGSLVTDRPAGEGGQTTPTLGNTHTSIHHGPSLPFPSQHGRIQLGVATHCTTGQDTRPESLGQNGF